jgi:NAD(P)H dehydrogenase (quinone)
MADAQLIAVTGATGEVGSRLCARLAAHDARLRMVVRDPSRALQLPGAEVRVASGYAAGQEMRDALTGADALFLMPGTEAPDRVDQHRTAVAAAAAAGVKRIIYLSMIGAAEDATFTLARDHWHTEQAIRATGLRWTFLRMNLYMDFVPNMVAADGVIRGPAGDGAMAAVLRDDVAAAAAGVLTSDGHDGQTYELTGPSSFTLAEAAERMSAATGKRISFHDESDDEAFASRAGYGAPDSESKAGSAPTGPSATAAWPQSATTCDASAVSSPRLCRPTWPFSPTCSITSPAMLDDRPLCSHGRKWRIPAGFCFA